MGEILSLWPLLHQEPCILTGSQARPVQVKGMHGAGGGAPLLLLLRLQLWLLLLVLLVLVLVLLVLCLLQ